MLLFLEAMKKLILECKPGKKIAELCKFGDEHMNKYYSILFFPFIFPYLNSCVRITLCLCLLLVLVIFWNQGMAKFSSEEKEQRSASWN